jgi:hypothetical protein
VLIQSTKIRLTVRKDSLPVLNIHGVEVEEMRPIQGKIIKSVKGIVS